MIVENVAINGSYAWQWLSPLEDFVIVKMLVDSLVSAVLLQLHQGSLCIA